ncbi:DUF4474 domain-containing protein [Frankia sp. Cas3]|uniref:DUF4474 domain-containing protein n=1 Tax=Frankia sp. Cas3 TaxID=3073926 RepID=UPI002AD3BA9D|nr:DUF4474 domain-containing protein [Frankia sp. Cas3]
MTPGSAAPVDAEWWCAPTAPEQPAAGGTVVISDVHLGNGARTCWYQPKVHDRYLSALLDYVIAHAGGHVSRLVILGDLFDFWTYPPDRRPPTLEEIIAANRAILGPGGKLGQAVAKLRGNALYIRGNHDIAITQEDLALAAGDPRLRLAEDIVVDGSGILLTHGHHFTMFNAPDPRYPGEVPVGHFVARAIAHLLETTLEPGKTAADLSDQGSPYGFSLSSFAASLYPRLADASVTDLVLDYFAQRCGLGADAPIIMANGSTTTINEAKRKYDGLWDEWVERSGGGEVGTVVATKAAYADYDGTYMAWFAQKYGWQRGAIGAVTGHTHVPREGILNSAFRYVNSGFECPSEPDTENGRPTGGFTFGMIGADGGLSVWCVVKRGDAYCVGPFSPKTPDRLVPSALSDYSCYVSITNAAEAALERVEGRADHGYYVVEPPATIAPGQTARFWLQDFLGPNGAEGGAVYTSAADGARFDFAYGCPTILSPNYARGGTSFVANSGSPPDATTPKNSVPAPWHPLYVDFQVGGDPGVPEWTPRSLLAQAVVAAGFWYDPRQDIIFSRMDPLQRQFGYAYGYDAAALAMNSVIDCEPIFFDYAGKTWMIELWKGQYGLETGCEIGVYNRPIGSSSPLYSLLDATVGKRPNDPTPRHNQFFDCARDSELLRMSSTLYRNGTALFSRGPERHWWLTGFKWGVLSDPAELAMDVFIECFDATMTSALTAALARMGYQNVTTNDNEVSFRFDAPKTPQPRDLVPAAVSVVRSENQAIVTAYQSLGLTSNDPNAVGDQAAAVIGRAFAIYAEEFFVGVVANLANLVGIAVQDLISTLTNDLSLAVDEVSQFVTDAGYTFTSWVNGIGSVITAALDFSCVVEISNRGGPYELVRDDFGSYVGSWALEPPKLIGAGGIGRCWLKDPKPSASGSSGWVRYAYVDTGGTRRTVTFTVSDPTGPFDPNTASRSSGEFNFYTKSGSVDAPWKGPNAVATSGHPFFVVFVWGAGPPPHDV